MGDEKQYTIQVKGTAYRFKPVPSEDFERVAIVQSLSVDSAKTIQALTRILKRSIGSESWELITDRYLSGEITLQELTIDPFKKLLKRQQTDEAKAKGKQVEPDEEAPASADDAE